jgi:hypothetical protein
VCKLNNSYLTLNCHAQIDTVLNGMLDSAAANTLPFVENLLVCLKMDKRFKEDLYKTKAPFSILCALDPRCDV